MAKCRSCLLLTNDREAGKEANLLAVDYLSLPLLLRSLWKASIMSREQVFRLVKEIEEKDNLVIKNLKSILD